MTSLVYNINNHSIFVNMPRVIYPVLKCNYLERQCGDPYFFYCFCASHVIIDIYKQNQEDGNTFFIPANLLKGSLAPNFTLKLSLETFPMCCAYIITMNYL